MLSDSVIWCVCVCIRKAVGYIITNERCLYLISRGESDRERENNIVSKLCIHHDKICAKDSRAAKKFQTHRSDRNCAAAAALAISFLALLMSRRFARGGSMQIAKS